MACNVADTFAASNYVSLDRHPLGHLRLGKFIICLGVDRLLTHAGKICRTVVAEKFCLGRLCARFDMTAAGIAVCLIVDNTLLAHHIAQTLLRGECQGVRTVVTGDDVFEILWIEHPDFLDRNVEDSRNLIEMHIFVDDDGVGRQMALDDGRRYAMLIEIVHHIVCSDEHGDISSGLRRQIFINLPEILFTLTRTAQSLVDVTGSAVVGGDGKRPVIINLMQLFEIACGVARREAGVAALVNQ